MVARKQQWSESGRAGNLHCCSSGLGVLSVACSNLPQPLLHRKKNRRRLRCGDQSFTSGITCH